MADIVHYEVHLSTTAPLSASTDPAASCPCLSCRLQHEIGHLSQLTGKITATFYSTDPEGPKPPESPLTVPWSSAGGSYSVLCQVPVPPVLPISNTVILGCDKELYLKSAEYGMLNRFKMAPCGTPVLLTTV